MSERGAKQSARSSKSKSKDFLFTGGGSKNKFANQYLEIGQTSKVATKAAKKKSEVVLPPTVAAEMSQVVDLPKIVDNSRNVDNHGTSCSVPDPPNNEKPQRETKYMEISFSVEKSKTNPQTKRKTESPGISLGKVKILSTEDDEEEEQPGQNAKEDNTSNTKNVRRRKDKRKEIKGTTSDSLMKMIDTDMLPPEIHHHNKHNEEVLEETLVTFPMSCTDFLKRFKHLMLKEEILEL